MKIVSGVSTIALVALLAMAGDRPASAADQTSKEPHHRSTATRAKHPAPSPGRQSGSHWPGRQSGERRGGEQGHQGYPGIPGLPGASAPVQAIIGGIIGGVLRQAQPVAPSGYWYYCDASGRYYPYVASCASGWRPVRPQ